MAGIRIGRVWGIDVRLDPSLFIIFMLITFNLALGLIPAWHPDWGAGWRWGLGFVGAVTFLASILAHEFAHAAVSRAFGGPVRDITLFLFGGVAHIEREPSTPLAEFAMAVVGPLVSAVIGVGLTFVAAASARPVLGSGDALAVVTSLGPLGTLFAWLGPVNLFIALFNLLPGFPLDGGRILRAALWAILDDFQRATRLASRAGQALGWGMVASGLLMGLGVRVPFLGTGLAAGVWIAFLGWFLARAARATYGEVVVERILENVSVERLMTRDVDRVDPDTTIDALVERHLTRFDQQIFPVVTPAGVVGVVSVADVRRVPRQAWPQTPVRDIMAPLEAADVANPEDSAMVAWKAMARQDRTEMPVVERDHLLGLVRQRDLLRWLSIFREQSPA